jgi:hypothetical protein
MEANLEAYLAQKGIEYEKVTKRYTDGQMMHYYILERFVKFDDNFDFMASVIDKYTLLGKDEYTNIKLDVLSKNNIKYKEVLKVDRNCLYFSIQCEIENIIFFSLFIEYETVVEIYEFRKFIKHNTMFECCRESADIIIPTNKLGLVEILNRFGKVILIRCNNEIKFGFTNFQEFMTWLAENMPEYLRNDDIKIALKD